MPLTLLSVNRTRVSDLSPLRGKKLTGLYFANTKIAELTSLNGMPLLEMNCESTPVSDLSPLVTITTLRHLFVGRTKVTAAAVDALQKALPNCKIYWGDSDKPPGNAAIHKCS